MSQNYKKTAQESVKYMSIPIVVTEINKTINLFRFTQCVFASHDVTLARPRK